MMSEERRGVGRYLSRLPGETLRGIGEFGDRSPGQMWEQIVGGGSSKSERYSAAVGLAVGLVPGLGRWIEDWLVQTDGLPLALKEVRYLASGCCQDVFLAWMVGGESVVIKIDRDSLFLESDELAQLSRRILSEKRELRQMLEPVVDVLPPEEIVVLNSPFRGRRALAVIQPYYEGLRCVFEEVDGREWQEMRKSRAGGIVQLRKLVTKMGQMWDEGLVLDLTGKRNLCLDDGGRLLFLDTQRVHCMDGNNKDVDEWCRKVYERINHLKNLVS